jgi:hypothetical protein
MGGAPYAESCEPPVVGCDPARDALPGRGGLLRLAERGTIFTHFYAASAKCLPSRAATVSGKHGNWTGANDNGYADRLPRNADTLVKQLRERGHYRTGLIGKWHISGNPLATRRPEGFADPPTGRDGRDTCEDGFDEAIYYDSPERPYFKGPRMRCACARASCAPAGPASCPCADGGTRRRMPDRGDVGDDESTEIFYSRASPA